VYYSESYTESGSARDTPRAALKTANNKKNSAKSSCAIFGHLLKDFEDGRGFEAKLNSNLNRPAVNVPRSAVE
jgi:hypothetical protein